MTEAIISFLMILSALSGGDGSFDLAPAKSGHFLSGSVSTGDSYQADAMAWVDEGGRHYAVIDVQIFLPMQQSLTIVASVPPGGGVEDLYYDVLYPEDLKAAGIKPASAANAEARYQAFKKAFASGFALTGGLGSTLTAVEGQDFANSQGVLLKWIQPGTFQMGSTSGTDPDRNDDEVQHTVTLTRGFWLSDHEVTQAEYQAVMGNNPSHFPGDLNRPVEMVTWNDAVSYCQKLTDRERAAGRITAQQAYRLPTEAEWEYAARAGTTGARYTVNGYDVAESLDYIAWYYGNSKYPGVGRETHPVKGKQPNAWGLYDMIGNVWEWCEDWYGDYPFSQLGGGSVTDPTGPLTGAYRVTRGGSWYDGPRYCRSAKRYRISSVVEKGIYGFRPALSAVR